MAKKPNPNQGELDLGEKKARPTGQRSTMLQKTKDKMNSKPKPTFTRAAEKGAKADTPSRTGLAIRPNGGGLAIKGKDGAIAAKSKNGGVAVKGTGVGPKKQGTGVAVKGTAVGPAANAKAKGPVNIPKYKGSAYPGAGQGGAPSAGGGGKGVGRAVKGVAAAGAIAALGAAYGERDKDESAKDTYINAGLKYNRAPQDVQDKVKAGQAAAREKAAGAKTKVAEAKPKVAEVKSAAKSKAPAKSGGKGPHYPVYQKDSAEAKSFRKAFASARKSGAKEFTWQGRKYNTKIKK